MKALLLLILIIASLAGRTQSKVWVADQGNGTYKNPIVYADYSDPDVIRVGTDYYMTSSSFEDVPGLPVLHSKDLVNWTIIGHALPRLTPLDHFAAPRHGEGVWAPSLRYHNSEFYLYYPDPDFGIYLLKAKNAAGPWSEPTLVVPGKGLIDPCPLWDADGEVYLVHAFAGSRAGIKSVIAIKNLDASGTKAIDEGVIVYDGHALDPTIEGPKFYQRNGYYYIFAPAGGVSTGWQTVLRSKKIYGPYERKVVMQQGKTPVNGPHQGAWITTPSGEDWFIHFQDKDAYGRVVHLQPMKWVNDWPVIGIDTDGDGIGEPVLQYRKPAAAKGLPVTTPAESDEFNTTVLRKQWQWMGNPRSEWMYMNADKGMLRLYSVLLADTMQNLWQVPSVLQQKFPAEEFQVTTKLSFTPNTKIEGEQAGLAIMGLSYASIGLISKSGKLQLVKHVCMNADKGEKETETIIASIDPGPLYLRVTVKAGGKCQFSYSVDGNLFKDAGEIFTATPGRWKGAKFGLYCTRTAITNDAGWVDVDWVRVER